ncbi:MAG TPA: hypothetical protein VM431_05055 [Phycisphaerae bacterium]|nr:hypothetical protein [Phycisphaerae bacterium]
MRIQGGKCIVIASAVLLVLASCEIGYADFAGTVDLTSNFGDWLPGDPPVPVPPGALLTIDVTGTQAENAGGLSTSLSQVLCGAGGGGEELCEGSGHFA